MCGIPGGPDGGRFGPCFGIREVGFDGLTRGHPITADLIRAQHALFGKMAKVGRVESWRGRRLAERDQTKSPPRSASIDSSGPNFIGNLLMVLLLRRQDGPEAGEGGLHITGQMHAECAALAVRKHLEVAAGLSCFDDPE